MSQTKFEQLTLIYRATSFEDGGESGLLNLADQALLDAFLAIVKDCEEFGISVTSGDIDRAQIGDKFTLGFNTPRTGIGRFHKNIAKLLSGRALYEEPKRYYLIEEKFVCYDPTVPGRVKQYRQVLKLIALLKDASAYLDETAGKLVMINDGVYELYLEYLEAHFDKIDFDALQKLQDFFANDMHREQKLAILAQSVISVTNSAKPKERFACLLEHIPELQASLADGYRLFVANFSYEKVKDQLETAKLEEIGKIHKLFTDIQNQILGIPIAAIIVAAQMKTTSSIDVQFGANTAILLGCWAFAILTSFALSNQLDTLEQLEAEIKRKEAVVKKDYAAIKDKLDKHFADLHGRLENQKRVFCIVKMILLAGLVFVSLMYLLVTEPIGLILSPYF